MKYLRICYAGLLLDFFRFLLPSVWVILTDGRYMRSQDDKLLDKVLLLYALGRAAPVQGRLKTQKSLFLVELRLREHALPIAPHYTFFKHHFGPFSTILWDDFDDLAGGGFLVKSRYEPSERGKFLTELIIPALRGLPSYGNALHMMDKVLDYCQQRDGAQLKDEVYELSVEPDALPGEKMKIRDIPQYVDILKPPSGSWNLPEGLATLISNELSLTDAELKAARQQIRRDEPRLARQLCEAVNDTMLS